MQSDPEVLTLARAVLTKNHPVPWDSGRDSRGTASKKLSQSLKHAGTPNIEENQSHDATVPPSQAIGRGTVGQQQNPGTAPGTVGGQQYAQPAHHYSRVLSALQAKCPSHVEIEHWQQVLADAEAFLARWGEQAAALGWTARELFGLHTPPERPAPSYQRFSRYDETGLIWLLDGRPVVTLTAETAAIQTASGGILTYRKYDKPAFGSVGDSLDDFAGALRMTDANRPSPRQRLPNRRTSETLAQQAGALSFAARPSRFDDGSFRQVFQQNHKVDPVVGIMASNSTIAASLALQFGCPVEVLRTTLCRNARGNATGSLGDVALDMFAVGDEEKAA